MGHGSMVGKWSWQNEKQLWVLDDKHACTVNDCEVLEKEKGGAYPKIRSPGGGTRDNVGAMIRRFISVLGALCMNFKYVPQS